MIRKSKDFLNLPIISCHEGITVGTTVKFLINATEKKVSSIIVSDDEYYKGVKLLPVNLILGVGNDALVINKSSNIVPYSNIATAEDLLKEQIDIISSVVINNHGKKEGIVEEFEIDDEYNIVNVIINKNSNLVSIPIDKVKVFGKKLTIIEDEDIIEKNGINISDDNIDKEKELHSDVNVVSPLDNLPTNSINDTNDINDINKINLYEYDVYYDSKFISDFKVGNKTYKKGTNFNEEILNEIYSIEPNKLKDLVNVLE
ncbi:PRC-barrel domain-containing protein [Megamonas funiformis]